MATLQLHAYMHEGKWLLHCLDQSKLFLYKNSCKEMKQDYTHIDHKQSDQPFTIYKTILV